jgi:hypothetical protein
MRILVLGLIIIKSSLILAQNYCSNLTFINHLINSRQYDEATYCLKKIITNTGQNQQTLDSINYYYGWAAYCQKKLDTSANFLSLVSENSPFYYKSVFFEGYNYCFLGDYKKSKLVFENIPENDSVITEIKNFELSGISLLQKDYEKFKFYKNKIINPNYAIAKEKDILNEVYNKEINFNRKSMLLAGLLSAAIPGCGKIYTGKIGEGVSSFISISALAALTLENYYKAGKTNYKTLFFGSAFTVFYIGNIYGSIISVKVYRNEFNKTNENTILLNIHVPLRNKFN